RRAHGHAALRRAAAGLHRRRSDRRARLPGHQPDGRAVDQGRQRPHLRAVPPRRGGCRTRLAGLHARARPTSMKGGAMSNLDLGLIGNGSISALIDGKGEIVWSCMPRFDSNPVFCSLLREGDGPEDFGFFSILLDGMVRCEQHYMENTAILVTRLYDGNGSAIEITDFCPRFHRYGRAFRPMMLVRRITKLSGSPRLRIRLRPSGAYGAERVQRTFGSNHVRFLLPELVLRLTTDASVTTIMDERSFFLEDTVSLILGPDETLTDAPGKVSLRFLEDTTSYWFEWVRNLAIPFEWQDAVIRSAITLKLNTYDE